ncbi:MAG: methyltransferase domain-containing protein [Pseudonocardiaceae bacterium]
MTDFGGGKAADAIGYLDNITSSTLGLTFKRELLGVLDLRPGHTALDLGCGPGSDLAGIRERIAPTGLVIGIDHDSVMCEEARRRFRDFPDVDVRCGDAHALPLPNNSIDRVRAERVLMHVTDPPQVLAELRRVLRPGGMITLAEPDWDTLVVDHPDQGISRAFTRFASTELVRHGSIGRQLLRLCVDVGFRIRFVTARTTVHRDFSSAHAVWGLDMATERAVTAGYLTKKAGRNWLEYLRSGPFLGAITFFTVVAESCHLD